jgi:hypothetical protein
MDFEGAGGARGRGGGGHCFFSTFSSPQICLIFGAFTVLYYYFEKLFEFQGNRWVLK